ncbi:MAG: hypothetical protein H6740_24535 [Alphaproteobacteria bacterium]|nr:hypothetical protein [Alphaproteobacteria bacterium]
MRPLLLLASSLVLLTACAIEEADFPEKFGQASCSRYKECDKGDYESRFDSKEECVNDYADVADFILDAGDLFGADYNPEKGRDCITEIRSATCEDVTSGDIDCDVFGD